MSSPPVDFDMFSMLFWIEILQLHRQNLQAKKNLADERIDARNKTREFRTALKKARSDALTCRARVSALQRQLKEADISGLQVRGIFAALNPKVVRFLDTQ